MSVCKRHRVVKEQKATVATVGSEVQGLLTTKPQDVRSAWAYFAPKRPQEVRRNIQLKFHKPSWGKVQELLWAHVQVTNLRSAMLRTLGPYYALECLHLMKRQQTLGNTSDPTQILGEVIDSCFRLPKCKLPRLMLREQPFLSLWLRGGEMLAFLAQAFALLDAAAEQRVQQDRVRRATKAKASFLVKERFLKLWLSYDQVLVAFAQLAALIDELAAYKAHEEQEKLPPPIRVPGLRDWFPVSAVLFAGACRETARDLIGWHNRLMSECGQDSSTGEVTSSPEELYAAWLKAMKPYETVAQEVIPFGPEEGKTFAQVGKRGVRWLQERLMTKEVVEETLVHVEVLLHPERYRPDEVRRASHARHPWKTKARAERAPRASRLAQRSLDPRGPRVRLDAMEPQELYRLRDELMENLQFVDDVPRLQQAAEVFLSKQGLRYPDIEPVLDAEEQAREYRRYLKLADKLHNPFPRTRKDVTEFCTEDLEAVEIAHRHDIQRSAHALRKPTLQPLAFKRSMRPLQAGDRESRPSFALLYSKHQPSEAELNRRYAFLPLSQRRQKVQEALARGLVYNYVLAVVVHSPAALRPPHARKKFTPELTGDYYYVDYPATRFVPPAGDDVSLMIFPLECGWGSEQAAQPHSDRLLRTLIEERLAVQLRIQEDAGNSLPLSECVPAKGALGAARITCLLNDQGRYEFLVNIPVPRPVPEARVPEHVIGFHEHDEGYAYAVVTADGELVDMGEVPIPSHVLPREGQAYPRNYVYEVRKAMINLAVRHNAYIGIEDTSEREAEPTLSRAENDRRSRRPSRTVVSELHAEALLAGLLRPQEIRGVPERCCGTCGERLHASSKTVVSRVTRVCHTCGSPHLLAHLNDQRRLTCFNCGMAWRSTEPWFVCDACDARLAPTLNRAVVVARLTLKRLVQLHMGAVKQEVAKARERHVG